MSSGSLLSVTFVLVMAPSKHGSSPHVLRVAKTWKIIWNRKLARYDQRPGWSSGWFFPVLPSLPTLKQQLPTQYLRTSDFTLHVSLETCCLQYSLPPEGEKKSIKTQFWLKTPRYIRQHIFHLLSWGALEKVKQYPTNEQVVLFQCFQF